MKKQELNYLEYLKSDHWLRFRHKYFNSGRPKRCLICDAKKVELHHLTYKRIGRELLGDVVPLCHKCHMNLHTSVERNRVAPDSWGYIQQQRGLLGLSRLNREKLGITDARKKKATFRKPVKSGDRTKILKARRIKAKRLEVFERLAYGD